MNTERSGETSNAHEQSHKPHLLLVVGWERRGLNIAIDQPAEASNPESMAIVQMKVSEIVQWTSASHLAEVDDAGLMAVLMHDGGVVSKSPCTRLASARQTKNRALQPPLDSSKLDSMEHVRCQEREICFQVLGKKRPIGRLCPL